MTKKPAVIISEELEFLLRTHAVFSASFFELTGKRYPWDVDFNIFQSLRKKLSQNEDMIRKTYENEDITCVISGNAVYWQTEEGMALYFKELGRTKEELEEQGPLPIWKLTSAEIFASHISNMRQLIMAVAHDAVLLDQLKDPLANNHLAMQREFEKSELMVRSLLEEIRIQGENLSFITNNDIQLLERVRITRELFDRGELNEFISGFSELELQRVQGILEKRIKEAHPKFRQRLESVFDRMQLSLREGENTQLRRASRWEITFALLGLPPAGYRGQAKLATVERENLTLVVSSREKEMGESESGKDALARAEEAKRMAEKGVFTTPKEKPIRKAVPQPEKLTDQRRMAFIERMKKKNPEQL